MKGWRLVALAGLLAASLAAPARAGQWEDAGWGALAVLANVGYMPAKLVYAGVGAFTGGAALGLTGGDFDTANSIWQPSLEGTYVLTPSMMSGQENIAFAGSPLPPAAETPVAETPVEEAKGPAALGEEPLGGS